MESLQRLIINVLSNNYNFRIIEFIDDNGNSFWGLYKAYSDLSEIILFLESYQVKQDYHYMHNYVKRNYDEGKPIRVHLVLIDTHEASSLIAENIQHPYEESNILFDLVLIDRDQGEVLYADQSAYEIGRLMHDIIIAKSRPKAGKTRKVKPIITYVLISLNVIIFVLTVLLTALLSGNILDFSSVLDIREEILLLLGAKNNVLIDRGQYYRLFTAMFLHGGLMHIGFNMYALYSLGPFVEGIYGKLRFLIIYIIGGVASTLFSYMFSRGTSVGASGAIFALLGCALVFGFKMRRNLGKSFLNNILQVIALNLVLGFSVSNIDNYGHIGGLIGGILISLILPLPKNNDCRA